MFFVERDLSNKRGQSMMRGDLKMNREETEERLEEAAELVSTHLGCVNQEWEIKDRTYANKENELILIFKVEYEEEEED